MIEWQQTEEKMLNCGSIGDLIVKVDRSSVLYWLVNHSDKRQRHVFRTLMTRIGNSIKTEFVGPVEIDDETLKNPSLAYAEHVSDHPYYDFIVQNVNLLKSFIDKNKKPTGAGGGKIAPSMEEGTQKLMEGTQPESASSDGAATGTVPTSDLSRAITNKSTSNVAVTEGTVGGNVTSVPGRIVPSPAMDTKVPVPVDAPAPSPAPTGAEPMAGVVGETGPGPLEPAPAPGAPAPAPGPETSAFKPPTDEKVIMG